MLRAVLVGISLLMLVAAIALFGTGQPEPGALMLVVWAVILVIGVVFERTRYKAILDAPPNSDFQPTPERFVDPETKLATVVYFNAKTGKRVYVRAP
jgi:hypothetical protein